MDPIKTVEYARALYTAHGGKAEAEVAEKVRHCEAAGRKAEAEDWQAVRRAIAGLRGPHQG
ncbi:hypothetical protein SAMN05444007_101354 [Cribrihabitans marinus]|uniref:Uncharacterized protein n=1 Tax=Cribrihabitans marinus TaxID=1227549 RepID=A0A1H6QZN5_9RHOB|nr:hypothetical protein [Cribrihabitans marinus]GGH20205.1 hypothetical protein GCM10010973_03980 [Cribrihabitans marinus]SEI48993.1 hypothetical protein SAMN05444007_101354 [Cribrihabitans marinus]